MGVGLEWSDEQQDWPLSEIAYRFDRELEQASHVGDYHPGGTVMMRTAGSYRAVPGRHFCHALPWLRLPVGGRAGGL
jgi:hypothetical protein